MKSRPHDEAMAELYRSDPALALDVVNGILVDDDQAELRTALRHMTKAFGGVQAVAEQSHLNPAQPCRMVSHTITERLMSRRKIKKAVSKTIESLCHDLATLHKAGAISKVTMREFDTICHARTSRALNRAAHRKQRDATGGAEE